MPITYPLSLPAGLKPARARFTPRSVVATTASPFTGEVQTYVHQGQWWEAELKFPPLDRADGEALVAFLLSLNGMEGTFLLAPPGAETPRGLATGTPRVNGSSQTGTTLNTDGWTTSRTNILRAGDWIQLGSSSTARLYRVLADVNSNASGQAALDLWPKIRTAPADNALITVTNAAGLWRLAANDIGHDLSPPFFYGVTIPCVSVV